MIDNKVSHTGNQSHQLSDVGMLTLGLVFLATPLLFVVFVPSAYATAHFYLRLIAALGGAFVGAFIPGALNVQTAWAKATGALGIFLLVFVINPSWNVYEAVDSEGTSDSNVDVGPADFVLPNVDTGGIDSLPVSDSVSLADLASREGDEALEVCLQSRIQEHEGPLEEIQSGIARAPSPGLGGGRKTDDEQICIAVGPNQRIITAATTRESCLGDRCSVTAPEISPSRDRVCVTVSAWSESKSFGGGGRAEYKLIARYQGVATEPVIEAFRAACRRDG